jgi:hypothetical protein
MVKLFGGQYGSLNRNAAQVSESTYAMGQQRTDSGDTVQLATEDLVTLYPTVTPGAVREEIHPKTERLAEDNTGCRTSFGIQGPLGVRIVC